ncbi:bifunctional hydroxymethylpyrimidine kinase/phosphomethylpyrimidine kinase [Neisseriaceae bacterium TC5R-5]|nr:bifunctional hydroxymethylpyrimidine kinase/phosphomethylpyrimidine kinase [Neisseriaceae bacterium TC5R-5]
MKIANVLSIAGTDPSGGAGIQADLKTFSAFNSYGMAAITAVVAQNTCGVKSFHAMAPAFVAEQIDAVFTDIQVDAVKVGMVANAAIAEAIAERLSYYRPAIIVLDPVMVAKSGDRLLSSDAIAVIREQLIPLATIITPNLPEASILLDCQLPGSTDEMYALLDDLLALGSAWVLLKGGHLQEPESTDLLKSRDRAAVLTAQRIETNNNHGTGCTLSAALTALLTRFPMEESVALAKDYLTKAMLASQSLNVGKGNGPVHHFHALWR